MPLTPSSLSDSGIIGILTEDLSTHAGLMVAWDFERICFFYAQPKAAMRVDEEGVMELIRQGYNIEEFDLKLLVRSRAEAEGVESTQRDPGSNGRFLGSPYVDVTPMMINHYIKSSKSKMLTPTNRPHYNATTGLCKIFLTNQSNPTSYS